MRRREVLKAGAALPALAAAPALAASGDLALYDPAIATSRAFAVGAAKNVALSGDRVRLLRSALAEAPQRIIGLTHYADFLWASELAGEAGYRIERRETRNALASPALHAWSMVRG